MISPKAEAYCLLTIDAAQQEFTHPILDIIWSLYIYSEYKKIEALEISVSWLFMEKLEIKLVIFEVGIFFSFLRKSRICNGFVFVDDGDRFHSTDISLDLHHARCITCV